MEVAVARVGDDGGGEEGAVEVCAGVGDEVGEAGEGHACVGDHSFAVWEGGGWRMGFERVEGEKRET